MQALTYEQLNLVVGGQQAPAQVLADDSSDTRDLVKDVERLEADYVKRVRSRAPADLVPTPNALSKKVRVG